MRSPALESFIFGTTVNGLAIPGYRWRAKGPLLFVLGGVHGEEHEGVIAAHGLLNHFAAHPPSDYSLVLVPALNLDGVLVKSRKNANGIDLNRNLATKDWTSEVANERYFPGTRPNSEPENMALVEFIEREKPRFVISLHSYKPVLNVNGDCVPEAEAIREVTGYDISPTIGYPTPGCLGTYTGIERGIPTITYEVERGQAPAEIVKMHVPAVLKGLAVAAKRHS